MAKNNRKIVKRTIAEMIGKGEIFKSPIVMKDGSKLNILNWGIEEVTMDYILRLSDGSSRNFSNTRYHQWEVKKNFEVVTANKERQYK